MPKGKKKGKFEHRRTEALVDDDVEMDSNADNASEISGQSDLRSNHDEAENEAQEKLEEKVLETVDALSARAAAARATALSNLRSALQRRPMGHVLGSHRVTLADHVTRALRRGKDAEKRAAAALAPILALQIGEEGVEEFVREIRQSLTLTAADRGASLEARTECCLSLSALCYMLEEDLAEILEVMKVYETIFSGSYLKGDGTVKVSGAAVEEGAWHAAALDGWGLLFALLEPSHGLGVLRATPPGFARLVDLLSACSLDVRMSAGVALAVAHESVVECQDPAVEKEVERALPKLEALSTDSHKYRAKRDRKLQRATFRDILRYFEEDEVPTLAVRVCGGAGGNVTCETWASRAGYECLAGALGAGLQTLAQHSEPLRRSLGLGELITDARPQPKMNKLQRHLANAAACKARTVARNKNRDKRSAALSL